MQKTFWCGVIEAVPDLGPDALTVFFGKRPRQPRVMHANFWADTLVLGELVRFESETPSVSADT